MLSNKRMCEILEYFTEFSVEKGLSEVCEEAGLSREELLNFIDYLHEANCELTITEDDQITLSNPNQRTKLMELMKDYTQEQDEVLTLEDLESESFDLESIVFEAPVKELNVRGDIVEFIEEAIEEEVCLKINLTNVQSLVVFPHRVVFIDGSLSIVGESAIDNCLLNIEVERVQSASEIEVCRKRMFSSIEVEDFLSSIRAVDESEVRLVLKVYSQENFNSNLRNHHLGNQCMVTNAEGEHIWAASVEPSDEIFQWVYELGADVEILDPSAFKKEFLNYCEAKLKKLA